MILLKLNFEDNGVVVDDGEALECKVKLIDSLGQATMGCGAQGVLSWKRLIIFRVFGRGQVGTLGSDISPDDDRDRFERGVRHRRARGRRAKWADCELIRCNPCPDAALDGGGI